MATAMETCPAVTEEFAVVETEDKKLSESSGSRGRGDRASSSSSKDSKRSDSISENGKKKVKEDKPPTKVVIRRLPPSMTKEVFISQISPIPEHDYFYFVPGDPTAGVHMGFARAYINFTNQDDLFRFTETYDGYVFVDTKGQEYLAVVEFAPFQRIPKQRTKKKDILAKSIENDPAYIAFKDSLEAAAAEAAKPDVTSKQHFFETEIRSSTQQEVITTPLLEFLKQKRLDRARIRDEKREERKRKDAERKLRQKVSKEKKNEADEEMKDVKKTSDPCTQSTYVLERCRNDRFSNESSPNKKRGKHFSRIVTRREASCSDIQLLLPKERKENVVKESRNGKKIEKEKLKENSSRPREFRNKTTFLVDENKTSRDKRNDRRRTGGGNKEKKDHIGSGIKEKKDINVSNEGQDNSEPGDVTNISEKVSDASDKKRRGGRRPSEGGDAGGVDGEVAQSRKSSRSEKNKNARKERERRRRDECAAAKKNTQDKKESSGNLESGPKTASSKITNDNFQEKYLVEDRKTEVSSPEPPAANQKRRSSLDSGEKLTSSSGKQGQQRRRNSLESSSSNIGSLNDGKHKRQISLEDEDASARRSESDGGGGGRKKKKNKDEEKASRSDQDENKEKDPRPTRRIRNKDRPSIQIYRPGMGKLSKQRLEKKDAMMGSSTEVDSPSHSPSPKLPPS